VHEHVLKPLFSVPGPSFLLPFVFNLAVDCPIRSRSGHEHFRFGLSSLPMSLLGEGGLPGQPYTYVVGMA